METIDVLKGAKRILARETNWTKGAFARSKKTNKSVDLFGTAAGSFCLSGALQKILVRGGSYETVTMAIRKALVELGHGTIIAAFNDDPKTTFTDVKRVLNRAIEIEQSKK